MKKTICLLLAVFLLFTGCAGRNGDKSASVPDSVTQEGSAEAESPEVESQDALLTSNEPETSSSDADQQQSELVTMTITIPEGYTLAKIGILLEEKGLFSAEDFIAATQDGDFNEFPLVAEQVPDENRCFKLEGYLFPDTYEIYTTDPPDAIIRRMLRNTEDRITGDIRAKIVESGYMADEIITMASIIQKEAFGPEPMPDISSVLHNRLNQGMRLQCDVTIAYVEYAIKQFITGDINRYNEYYNTYKCAGLPAGAICNPGIDAIEAALSPASTDYLYFVTDADKKYYFSETWEGHEENVSAAGIG